ncbi:hypothetical protein [uncultured Aquimarina sp.]|uniref:hypothetical protein n=1 Tax=uncultured Aquimarina sp. TaxID=575652 RepID=UPI002614A8E8|nr:hypothetical protein [uncultured Aquimarina sp.]
MSTLNRTLIKNVNISDLISLIKNYYSIGRVQLLNYENQALFLDRKNYSIILSDSYIANWIEITFDFCDGPEKHDFLLKKISTELLTEVIYGYEQTTTGDARFLKITNGKIERDLYQKSYYKPHRIIMERNLGDKYLIEKEFKYPEIGRDLTGFKALDFDEIQDMFVNAGYKGNKNQSPKEEYTHLEWLKK